MERAIVTGAAGFVGSALVEELLAAGVEVVAVVRPDSEHNARIDADRAHVVECDLNSYFSLANRVAWDMSDSVFFHLAWANGDGVDGQFNNVGYTLDAVRAAASLGCRRIVCAGSLAEYGLPPANELLVETRIPRPNTAYGAAKLAAADISRQYAFERRIEWVWGRLFTVIGKHEPRERLLPQLYHALLRGRAMKLSSYRQIVDYLDVHDAADAWIALGERGVPGEVYNIASGVYKPVQEYVEELRRIVEADFGPSGGVIYGEDRSPATPMCPSVEKLMRDTGWRPTRGLAESVGNY